MPIYRDNGAASLDADNGPVMIRKESPGDADLLEDLTCPESAPITVDGEILLDNCYDRIKYLS